jgi:hypothetical protein
MKPLTMSLAVIAAAVAGLTVGYLIGVRRIVQRPSYLAVSLSKDRQLDSVVTVVQDDEGQYVVQGDEIQFLSDGPTPEQSNLRPFCFEHRRLDFFSRAEPMGQRTCIWARDRAEKEAFIIREGKAQRVTILARVNP